MTTFWNSPILVLLIEILAYQENLFLLKRKKKKDFNCQCVLDWGELIWLAQSFSVEFTLNNVNNCTVHLGQSDYVLALIFLAQHPFSVLCCVMYV